MPARSPLETGVPTAAGRPQPLGSTSCTYQYMAWLVHVFVCSLQRVREWTHKGNVVLVCVFHLQNYSMGLTEVWYRSWY
jgi:hypothetical protein